MALRRFLSTTRKDRTLAPTNTSNVMTPPSHTLTGRDSVGQPGTESSLTDTLARGVVEKSTLTSPNYSKHLSDSPPNSHLSEFC